jgi:hypothetical protein
MLKQTDLSALSIKPLANGAGHAFFEQSVFKGGGSDHRLQRLRFAAEILHFVESSACRQQAALYWPQGTPSATTGHR